VIPGLTLNGIFAFLQAGAYAAKNLYSSWCMSCYQTPDKVLIEIMRMT